MSRILFTGEDAIFVPMSTGVSKYLIYALSDPRSGEVRYVGKTENKPRVRLNHHLYRARWKVDGKPKFKQHIYCWIRSLGMAPTMEIVEECPDHNSLIEAEKFWIEQFRALGFRLVNLTCGGEGAFGYKHTPETRRRMSEMKRGKKFNWNPKRKIMPENIPDIVAKYTEGHDAVSIGRQYSVTGNVILKHLRKVGVQTRNATAQRWTSARMGA